MYLCRPVQYPTGAGYLISLLLTYMYGIFLGVVCIYISQKKIGYWGIQHISEVVGFSFPLSLSIYSSLSSTKNIFCNLSFLIQLL